MVRRPAAHRRLLALQKGLAQQEAALVAAAAAPLLLDAPAAIGETSAKLLPMPLDVKGRGVAPRTLQLVRRRKAEALVAEDYRAAAEMHDLLTVLSPLPRASALTLADASPPTLEGQQAFFRRWGFVVLPKVFAGDALARLTRAWRRVQRPAGPAWREKLRMQEEVAAEFDKTQGPDETAADFYRRRSEAGLERSIGRNYYDIPTPELYRGLLEELKADMSTVPDDAALLDLLDPPRLIALLRALLGEQLHMFAIQARTYPTSSSVSAGGTGLGQNAEELRGYIGWHRDFDGPGHGVSVNPSAVIKVFTFFESVAENGGATTVVPGSHRLTFDPRHAFRMRDFDQKESDGTAHKATEHVDPYYHVQPQSAMPNAFKFAVNAGDVCLFDTTIWHTASPNESGSDRENTIIHYQANSEPAVPGVPVEVLALADEAGLLSSERKELLAYYP